MEPQPRLATNLWTVAVVVVLALIFCAISIPNLLRSRDAANASRMAAFLKGNPIPLQLVSLQRVGAGGDEVAPANEDRKLIRTAALNIVVQNSSEAVDKIRILTEDIGGFLVSSQTAGGPEAATASLTIRVPVARFDEVRAAIRKLGLRVDSERLDAQDVTRQYVDQEARLRNLRAEEVQYLGILKRASTVKDTLEVTGKLSEVRGQIEQQQAEFNALSKQVETVAIAISLYREADVRVFGLNWRPHYQLKMSARDGVLALGDYIASITAFLFYLPAVLLWLGTIMVGAAIAWRTLKWIGRVFFSFPKASIPAEGPN